MSNVLARKRGISSMEFYKVCIKLRSTLIGALMNERITPKRWRPLFTFPISSMFDDLFTHLIKANNTFTNSPERVAKRKDLQRDALDDLERIDDKLQQLLEQLYYGKIDADHPIPAAIEDAGFMIDDADKLIKAWRKSTKLVTNGKTETEEE